MNPYTKKFVQSIFVPIMAIMISITSSFLFQSKFHVSNEDAFRACDVARSGEIRYHVATSVILRFDTTFDQCSGTLIHKKYVLTLVDCVNMALSQDVYMEKMKVVVGTRTTPGDGITCEVEKIIVHPTHDYKTKTDNIALIKLKENVPLAVRPISLPDKRIKIEEGLELFASGFDFKNVRGYHIYDLRKFNMHVVSNERCRKFYASESHWNFTGKFCAIAALGHRPCLSDLGSPAANMNKEYVIGIHMHKKEKCSEKKKKPELFVDVSSYVDFIKSAIVKG